MAGAIRLSGAIALLAVACCCWGLPAAAEQPPQRVVSINLCADQYLLALADPGQIAAVSRLARDPGLSYLAGQAARVPVITGSAEEVVRLNPDLVLTGAFTRRTTGALLERFGVEVMAVPYAKTLEDVRTGLRHVALVLGVPAKGEALIAELDSEMAASRASGDEGPSLLHYQARGFVTGSRTLLGELLAASGFSNMADELGIDSLARVQLEQVVQARPERLLVDGGTRSAPGVGQGIPDHPALAAVLPPGGRLPIPDGLIACGGPATAAALGFLKEAAAEP